MRLTSREVVMLAVLAVVAVTVVGYLYIYEPIIQDYTIAVDNYKQKQSELDGIYSNLMSNDDMELLISNFKNKVNVLEKALPPVIYQEEVVLYLDKVLSDNNIDVTGTSFTEDDTTIKSDSEAPINDILSEYEKFIFNNKTSNIATYKDKTYNEEIDKEYKEFSVSINISGKYADIKKLMKDIENYEKKIVVKDLSVSKNLSVEKGEKAVNDNVTANMTLIFPYFYDNEVLKAINWPYEGKYGNSEPFTYASKVILSGTGGTNTGSGLINEVITDTSGNTDIAPKEDIKSYENPDFYIVLRPTISDASTITMGKYPIAYSTLYNENPGVETAFLNVIRDGETYKFQFGTMLQSYPGADEYEVFIPYRIENGEIILDVRSQPRMPSDDLSSTILTVNNSTGLPLNIHIYEDDKNFPRFRLDSKQGDNSVIYH